MKGFIAACLAHVPALQRARLKVPMHFAFSYDEEIGCLGAHSLAERLVGAVPRPQAVIVGEPTMMGVVNAQNAGGGIVATFTGVEAHSSMTHLGVSAIHFAGDFIH
jgi:acetylornithine deacetylase